MKIFIGNLAPEVNEEDLKQAAEAYGELNSVSLTTDETGQSKGFGFVELDNSEQGQALIQGLNGKDLKGQALRVNESRPEKADRSGKDRKGWKGLGGHNPNLQRNNRKAGSKGGGNKGGYSGGRVGSGEG